MPIINLHPRYLVRLSTYLPFLGITGIVIVILFTSTCAKAIPLEGGPVDTIPPQLISSYPIHKSTEFKGRKILLIFNKGIEIQDIHNTLVVTPKLARLANGPAYVCKVRGDELELNLEAPLENETTYTFNFKDAIRDTKEGTAAENLVLTFSTGAYVDSMYIAGQVKHLMTDQPVGDGIVALYKITDTDTVNIINTAPDYFTKTSQSGDFTLDHLKQGQYRICAGYSKENKIILDPSKDPYGFLPTPIELSKSVEHVPLYIVQANVKELKVQSSQPQDQYFEINFSKPVITYTLALAQESKRFKQAQLYSHLIEEGLTIRVYNTLGLLEEDMLEAKLTAQDAMGNMIEQNTNIHFRDKFTAKEKFTYTLHPAAGVKVNPSSFEVSITWNKPIKSIQTDSIFFVLGEADTLKLSPEEIIIHSQRDSITIQKKFELPNALKITESDTTNSEKNPNITLHMTKGACISVEKEPNEAVSCKYFIKNQQECGTIKGKVITQAPGFIIQLLDKDYQVVEAIQNESDYEFKDILPGNYRIRVLVLQGRDARWHFGNINKLEPPDRVIFYPHELSILPNWELDYIDFEI